MKRILLALAVLCAPSWLAAQSYTIVQNSGYISGNSYQATLSSNQTPGDAVFVGNNDCGANNNCTTNTCPTNESFTDGAASAGAGGDTLYALDAQSTATPGVCSYLGSAFGITTTTTGNTVTVGNYHDYSVAFAIEVRGLGYLASLDSSGATNSSVDTVTTGGNCTAGDFAWAYFRNGSGTLGAGSGWTVIGTPGSNGALAEWQTVASTGTVTATVTGFSGSPGGGIIACYKPGATLNYTIVQFTPNINLQTHQQFQAPQTAGDSNFVGYGACATSTCLALGTCYADSFTDNAGSEGGSGNNSYTTGATLTGSQYQCGAVGHAFDIVSTTSTNTMTSTPGGGSDQYPAVNGIEVAGLGAHPTEDSAGIISQTTGTVEVSTAGSCSAGDFAVAWFFSTATNPGLAAGTGWIPVYPAALNNGNGWLQEWQQVPSTGTVTATISGTPTFSPSQVFNAQVACYKPSSSSTFTRHKVVIQ